VNDHNPYAPPPIVAELALPVGKYPLDEGGLWRQASLLVIRKDTQLPPRCVKSNQPVDRFLKRSLVWMPRWTLVLAVISVPIFLIVAIILQKKATVHVGLADEWFVRRRLHMLTAWGIVLLTILAYVGGIFLLPGNNSDDLALLTIAMIFPILGAIVYGHFAARMVYAKKIDDHFVWLKGVCPEYLVDLPEWTGPKA
jgi:hypothetical protein